MRRHQRHLLPSLSAFLFLLAFLSSGAGHAAIAPVWQFNDLVAGEGEEGYRDGPFYRAQFRHPFGLVVSADGAKLYVADRDNHCVRQIDLERQNDVSTLAGTGEKGRKDGAFKQASFETPFLLLLLPADRLLVYDQSAETLRVLDLKAGQVSTLLKSGDPQLKGAPLTNVTQMLYAPQEDALYLTRPSSGALGRLDLKTKDFNLLSFDHARLPNPSALAFHKGKMYVADAHAFPVFRMEFVPPAAGAPASLALTEAAKGNEIVSLVSSGDALYAFQASDAPWVQLLPKPRDINIQSVWGPFLENGSKELDNLLDFKSQASAGSAAAPGETQRLFVSVPKFNMILSLRDYWFWEYRDSREAEVGNPNGLRDFNYPDAKPPHTFRILLLGDSHLYYQKEGNKRWPWGVFNRIETVGKKLETSLNLEASLRGSDTHFQVLDLAYERFSTLFLWPYIQAPSYIKKFDIDMVLLVFSADYNLSTYFEAPYLKEEGIPNWLANDSEFRLTPMETKLAQDPVLKDFYERCVAHEWVTPGKWDFGTKIDRLSSDPKIREDLVKLSGKPLGLFLDKLKGMRTQKGKAIPLHSFYVPYGSSGGVFGNELYRHFWADVCRAQGIEYTDLMDPYIALRTSLYPTTEFWGFYHFDENGHTFFSYLLNREILKRQWLPLPPP